MHRDHSVGHLLIAVGASVAQPIDRPEHDLQPDQDTDHRLQHAEPMDPRLIPGNTDPGAVDDNEVRTQKDEDIEEDVEREARVRRTR